MPLRTRRAFARRPSDASPGIGNGVDVDRRESQGPGPPLATQVRRDLRARAWRRRKKSARQLCANFSPLQGGRAKFGRGAAQESSKSRRGGQRLSPWRGRLVALKHNWHYSISLVSLFLARTKKIERRARGKATRRRGGLGWLLRPLAAAAWAFPGFATSTTAARRRPIFDRFDERQVVPYRRLSLHHLCCDGHSSILVLAA